MTARRRLTLVRHGATKWTLASRFCGWTDAPLDVTGREQAAALGSRLEGLGPWTGAWSSDLVRCTETAAAAGVEVAADPRLRELDLGTIEGMLWEDLSPRVQEGLLAWNGFVAPEGESVADMEARLEAFVDELEPGNHLVFTHGGPIRWFLALAGAPLRATIPPCEPLSITLPPP